MIALLSVFLSLFSLTSAQTLPACDSSFLDAVYSVVSSSEVQPNVRLLNITTTAGQSSYAYTLPAPYAFSQLNILFGLPSTYANAIFHVTLNGMTSQRTYGYNAGGTWVLLAPFRDQGTSAFTNEVQIELTNYNDNDQPTCTLRHTFLITNPEDFPSGVNGDPMFVGLRGQKYQVHGIDGAVYNLISDEVSQVNSRFVFLSGPRPCPVMPSTSKPSRSCWSHPGSYLGELGVQTSNGDRLVLIAGAAQQGFAEVTLNGEKLEIGSEHSLPQLHRHLNGGYVVYNSSHEITLKVSVFELVIENIDNFLNLREVSVSGADWRYLKNAHGLLGQTWQSKRYSGSVKEIEGEVDDYSIQSGDLMGTDFMFNRFHPEQ